MKTAINKKLTVGLTTMLLLIQPVFGQSIFGTSDCGQWVNSKTDNRKAWVLGFMSGMSMATFFFGTPAQRKANGDWLNKVNSADQIFLFVDNHCQKNPLDKVETAGLALYIELTSK
jgi:hypothetical protein